MGDITKDGLSQVTLQTGQSWTQESGKQLLCSWMSLWITPGSLVGRWGYVQQYLRGGGGRGGEPPIPGSKKPGENQQMPFSGQFYLSPYRDNPLWGLQQVNIGAVSVG